MKKMKKILKFLKKMLTIIASIPHDKLLHLFAGYVIAHIVNNLYCAIFTLSYGGVIAGFVVALAIGIAKEIYDSKHRETETPEVADAAYTIGGGFASSLISLIALL